MPVRSSSKTIIRKSSPDDNDVAAKESHSQNEESPLWALPSSGAFAVLTISSSILLHADAWSHLVSNLVEMREHSTFEEFSSAFAFWGFAVLIHPILEPIFWISEVLHASIGPKILGLIPLSFGFGSAAILYAIASFGNLRKGLGIIALAALLGYIGAGLDGERGLGDYNIQLDDSYQGKLVKGCPAPAEVQLITDFDIQKYQGKWYWHKVHDWTQFKQVYSTTLDIQLTPDKKGYINSLGIKGPSPNSSPLSWDKSPLANGASYKWSGRILPEDPPGVAHETGFGVKFPNYVVDIQADKITGDYKELIQFQCIEVGGVRLYEGIDFMSRSPEMTDAELDEMHARAKQAGLYDYGASPEQMLRIERRPVGAGPEENAWQDLWKQLGVDRALVYLSKPIDS
jgi:hypothetical protein